MRDGWSEAYREGEHLRVWEDPRPPRHLDELTRSGDLRPGDAALDLGCGTGREALHLAALGLRVVGLERSPAALEIARARCRGASPDVARRVRLVLATALALPVTDGAFALVHDRGCLHTFDEAASRRRLVQEAARSLRPGGLLVVEGARHDDDEAGVCAAQPNLFARRFDLERDELSTLKAPAGDLPARRLWLRRR
ncbi:MAG: class I SAM-dependent methyltransferase [Acidobacteriota bacterium]